MDKHACCLFFLYCLLGLCANGELVSLFNVNRSHDIPSLRHDVLRHKGLLTGDLPLGGHGLFDETAYYYTKLEIGSPPREYYLLVDTGSYLTWLRCDRETLYTPTESRSAEIIQCDHDMCITSHSHGCKPGQHCQYKMSYGDGSSSAGYLVSDFIQLNVVSGTFTTSLVNSSIILGCSVHESGNVKQFGARIDGLIGFGLSTLSFFSQLTASVPVRKTFAHCLDSKYGGGIFLLGKLDTVKVNTAPLIQGREHYRIRMEAIDVGNQMLQAPNGGLPGRETVIDSGSTLAYLPNEIYQSLFDKIMSNHPDLKVHTDTDNSECFVYNASIDDGFPVVTLHFEDSLQLVVYPHDYLYKIQVDTYCIGWKRSGVSKSLKDIAILGELVLSNKFVVYDLENQTIGWTEYDCSSPVKVQDGEVGAQRVYAPLHIKSTAHSNEVGSVVILLVVLFCCFSFFDFSLHQIGIKELLKKLFSFFAIVCDNTYAVVLKSAQQLAAVLKAKHGEDRRKLLNVEGLVVLFQSVMVDGEVINDTLNNLKNENCDFFLNTTSSGTAAAPTNFPSTWNLQCGGFRDSFPRSIADNEDMMQC